MIGPLNLRNRKGFHERSDSAVVKRLCSMIDDASRKDEKCGDEEGLEGHCAADTDLKMEDIEDIDRMTHQRLLENRGKVNLSLSIASLLACIAQGATCKVATCKYGTGSMGHIQTN